MDRQDSSVANDRPPPASPPDRLLPLPPEVVPRRLPPLLEPVTLATNQVLYEFGGPIDYAYFPTGSVISALTVMADGTAIEVATVGNEGLVGHWAATGGDTS